MSEEFQESDVIFSDHFTNPEDDSFLVVPEIPRRSRSRNRNRDNARQSINEESNNRGSKMTTVKKSSPVRIPASVFRCTELEIVGVDDEREMTPPHVIIGRRMEGKMAFSVCSGNGRTLKGRDLRRLRNSVLRMTGFLEV